MAGKRIIEVKMGNYAEDLPKGRKFQHPSLTLDVVSSVELAGRHANFHDLYRDLNTAKALGHESRPVHPLVLLCQAFNQGVEDLSLYSPGFLGMSHVTFGRFLYDSDTIVPYSEVYANKPKEDKSIVAFQSYALHEQPRIEQFRTERILQWNRVNFISNRTEEARAYSKDLDGDPLRPPEMKPLIAKIENYRSLRELDELKKRAKGRKEVFYENIEDGVEYHFSLGKTFTDSTQSDSTFGNRNISTIHTNQKAVEENPTAYKDGHRIQYGLLTLLTAAGIAASHRYLTTIGEVALDSVKFLFPVFPGSTLNDVRAEVIKKHEDHPANKEFAKAVTFRITARGSVPKAIKEEYELGKLNDLGKMMNDLKRKGEDHYNPVVVTFEETVMMMTQGMTK